MKLLLLSDLGGKIPEIQQDIISKTSLVLVAGDVTLGARHENTIQRCFVELGKLLQPPKPVLYIPGNHDYPAVAENHPWIPQNFTLLHNRSIITEIEGFPKRLLVIGFGGATLGLYNNFAFHEDEILTSISHLFEKTTEDRKDRAVFTILLVHDAPLNTALDFTYMKTHVGSESIRRVIETYQPDLAVCGHIHESPGLEHIGKTTCVNAGEARHGKYAIINVELTGIQVVFH
nr:metallophosphoesterase [Candidatus Sigynarchaeota archaeon]